MVALKLHKTKNGKVETKMNTLKLGDLIRYNCESCIVMKLGERGMLGFYSSKSKSLQQFNPVNIEKLNVKHDINLLIKGNKELKSHHERLFTKRFKGEFGKFFADGEVRYGTVVKGGFIATVLDRNGVKVWSVYGGDFKLRKPPTIKIPKETKGWVFRKYIEKKSINDYFAFSCEVYYKNILSFFVKDCGYGEEMIVTHESDSSTIEKLNSSVIASIHKLIPNAEETFNLNDVSKSYIKWFNVDRILNIDWEIYIKNSLSLLTIKSQ